MTVTDVDKRWALRGLAEQYVRAQVRSQLGITQELNPCVKHDVHLPPHITIDRPSLCDGVRIFYGEYSVNQLRRAFAPDGTIEDLMEIIKTIVSPGALMPRDCELVAEPDEFVPGYPGEATGYVILARYKQ